MKKIGVFICHCGTNISSTVDIEAVKDALKDYEGVIFVEDYKYMCSEPGQKLLREKVKETGADGVVVAACSPTLHENTFRNAVESIGLNRHQCEIANIREQCSWVHKDMEKATDKAIKISKRSIEKVIMNESLEPISVPVTRKALVVGGGIAGITLGEEDVGGGIVGVQGDRVQIGSMPGRRGQDAAGFEPDDHPVLPVLADACGRDAVGAEPLGLHRAG